ncbi:hypothetical protein PV10_06191 [Exophiala mesophila]|uniref:Uncharacterized protein n=1 Tax=Exophiala mesophila TaxID=212818 RepID=A0A0D1ZAG3_EXOME|nr:uncharacterized protein PV10_06191 [Exophiala mesophila]KIV91677.1 hypothetical protein PV10_06191 [Exophiala mesophila]
MWASMPIDCVEGIGKAPGLVMEFEVLACRTSQSASKVRIILKTYFNVQNHLLICPSTDIIQTYRDKAPRAKIVFNTAPDNALQAIQRRFPLSSNCTGHPGTDLGFEIYCDSCAS